MAIPDDDYPAIQKHLEERWQNLCPTCERPEADLVVQGYLPLVLSSKPNVAHVGNGDGVTLITVTCSYCGHTRFLDYHVAMGVRRG